MAVPSVERQPLPDPPEPRQFGLTADRVQHFQKDEEPWWHGLILMVWFLGGAPLICQGLQAILVGFEVPTTLVAVSAVAAWAGGGYLFFGLTEFAKSHASEKKKAEPDYAGYVAFQRAVADRERLWSLHLDRWGQMDGWTFEKELAQLFRRGGATVHRTKGSRDGGVDLVMTDLAGKKIIVQCKAHGKPIGPAPVRELYGTLVHDGAHEAWLVSKAGFSQAAQEFAKGKQLRLITIREILSDARSVGSAK